MKVSTEQSILERLTVIEGVYWIGRKAVRLTFLSQQQRALNLIWALHSTGKLTADSKVTVVGAGLAGLTAAFAASQLGAKVRLIESKLVPLHLQRGCQLRFVHPHVLDWPDPIAEKPLTDLPCLNWGADIAARISNTVLVQWAEISSRIEAYYGYEVRQIVKSTDDRPLVFAEGRNDNYIHPCDHLILGIGFGLERSLSNVPFLSYWENDNFGRPVITGPIPRRYLVTGCGDGGLIDAIRLRINAFDHAEFVYLLSRERDLDKVKGRLLEIDREVTDQLKQNLQVQDDIGERLRAIEKKEGGTFNEIKSRERLENDLAGQLLEDKYRSLDIPRSLRKLLTDQLREDTTVFLNSPSLSPLNLKASILNRFLVFLLREYGGLRYRWGEVELLPTVITQPVRVLFKHQEFPAEELEVHEVVVRHGPIPIVDRLFPKRVAEACRPGPDEYDDPTRQAQYPSDFLETRQLLARKRKVQLDYAIATSPIAAKESFNSVAYDRFGIEVVEGQNPSYVLRPRPANDPPQVRSLSPFYGIRFIFDPPLAPPPPRTKPGRVPDVSLALGIGIQNIGEPGVYVPHGIGTLGCFVRVKSTQERALLTTASAVGGPSAKVGDRIVRAAQTNPAMASAIASITKLHLPTPSSPRSSFAAGNTVLNEFEAAVAGLLSDVQIQFGFGTSYPNAPKLKFLEEIECGEQIGVEVFKVGWTSGLTRGRIENVATPVNVQGWGEQYWLKGLFGIASLDNSPFTQLGDVGAIVVRQDGVVLGLVVAGNAEQTFACPIWPVLSALGCELLLSE